MEYETLDQNYNKEMAYREEVIKSIETTRNMIESAVEYSNTLAASIKQLDEDKYKLIEFYDIIYQRQEETERKHKDIKTVVSQQEDTIKRGGLLHSFNILDFNYI
ncbi:UNVERIFIED_CONTAM: hypothetical protein PYX00_002885 [Menopon gallinae]|uniref:Uncharacterized protein n=1 Tax=Menopon gallinae TaxID=328185 RepID=A0AAW2HZI4_9NEOP